MLVLLCLLFFPSYPGVSHLWVQPTSMETVFLHSQPQMPSHDGIYTVFYGVGWIKGCKVLIVESKVICGFSTARKWRPPNSSVVQESAVFLSCSLPLSTSVYFSVHRCESPHLHSLSSHKPPVFPTWLLAWWQLLPDPCLFPEYCQHICISFIQISLLNHLREFCFLLAPWWIGWVYQVLHDLTSLLPLLPTLHCVSQPWQG